jgi:hypothetical protein
MMRDPAVPLVQRRASQDFPARLADQFDLVVHVDETRALEPLEKWARRETDLPEIYPTGGIT